MRVPLVTVAIQTANTVAFLLSGIGATVAQVQVDPGSTVPNLGPVEPSGR